MLSCMIALLARRPQGVTHDDFVSGARIMTRENAAVIPVVPCTVYVRAPLKFPKFSLVDGRINGAREAEMRPGI